MKKYTYDNNKCIIFKNRNIDNFNNYPYYVDVIIFENCRIKNCRIAELKYLKFKNCKIDELILMGSVICLSIDYCNIFNIYYLPKYEIYGKAYFNYILISNSVISHINLYLTFINKIKFISNKIKRSGIPKNDKNISKRRFYTWK